MIILLFRPFSWFVLLIDVEYQIVLQLLTLELMVEDEM
jgi:hypothetical protein